VSICLNVLAISTALALGGTTRPPLYHIKLDPQNQWVAGSGVADLALAPSPFDVALTADGHVIYDITVTASGLPAPAKVGATQYVAWVATADLAHVEEIGPLGPNGKASGHVALNKFIVVVTAEPAAVGKHWAGPVALTGFSPSTYLENYSGKELFNGAISP
jgi:hypothetical protein